MRDLLRELIPHAPQLGLYLAPDIPDDKLRAALSDYATDLTAPEVLALYDATLMGGAKDGAVFTADLLVFQNNVLEPVHRVRYADIVRVEEKRKLLGGQKVVLHVNRGRSTFELALDFSGKAGAASYVARFLREAMLREPEEKQSAETDRKAVREALGTLRSQGKLSESDYERLLAALE